ncbi:MAG: hypothetical protein WC932_05520 [archaeon]|jgi:hypothetical protein
MPIVKPIKPKLRPAKRIAPKTLENMKKKKDYKELKEILDQLQKPTLKQQDEIDKFHKKISTITPKLSRIIIDKKIK